MTSLSSSPIQADVEFLSGLHIMDYSLLLGVHDVDAAEEEDELVPPEGDDGDEEEGLDEEYDSGKLWRPCSGVNFMIQS